MDYGIKENADVGLHDCRTNKIRYDGQFIKFFIPDGFYFIHGKGESDGKENCNAEVTCHFADKYKDRFYVAVYRKNFFGQTVREDWTDKFVSKINSGRAEFEFVNTYRSYRGILFRGYIWKHRKPWWRECEIDIMTDEITYNWEERDAEPFVVSVKM